MCELLVGPLWRVRRERVSVWQSRSNDNLPVCECGDQLVCHSQSGFHTIREDEATRVQSFYVLRNALKSRVKWFPHQIKNKAGLAQETSYRAPWSQPIPEGSVNVTYNPNTSLLNWLWATAARFCLPNHVCLSLDRSAPKCLSLQNKPTPQHASSWGCGEEVASDLGNQAEEEHTTAACWNNKSDWNDCSTWVMLPSRAFNRTTWLQREKISTEYGRLIAYHTWKEVSTEGCITCALCVVSCKACPAEFTPKRSERSLYILSPSKSSGFLLPVGISISD